MLSRVQLSLRRLSARYRPHPSYVEGDSLAAARISTLTVYSDLAPDILSVHSCRVSWATMDPSSVSASYRVTFASNAFTPSGVGALISGPSSTLKCIVPSRSISRLQNGSLPVAAKSIPRSKRCWKTAGLDSEISDPSVGGGKTVVSD